ncbi:putative N,O-diacetyl muramidase [Amanita muscaria]
MKLFPILALALSMIPSLEAKDHGLHKRSTVQGIDISGYQTNVNWAKVKGNGVQFVYIKATEGTGYRSSAFNKQWTGATNVGLIRGAYHFARPDTSSGAAQAKFFMLHGGGWSGDGKTLPGALDIEYNPYGPNKCYGKSPASMTAWVHDFSNTYHAQTGRYPVIYTTTDWWKKCTGNNAGFGRTNPLWIAHFAKSIGTLPAGWGVATFWQYADHGLNPGDADIFNGDSSSLAHFARG